MLPRNRIHARLKLPSPRKRLYLKFPTVNLRTTKIKAVRFFERQDFEIELINIGCVYQLVVC